MAKYFKWFYFSFSGRTGRRSFLLYWAVPGLVCGLVMGLTVLLAMIVIIANMVVDILYGILDPRTREAR